MLFIVHFNWRNHSAKAGVTGIVNKLLNHSVQFSSVAQSCLTLLTPWTAALQASLSTTISRSLLISIELAMTSNHLILCSLLLLPSVFPSIRVFSNESVLCIRWPEYWSFSFCISPSNEYSFPALSSSYFVHRPATYLFIYLEKCV